FFSFSEHTGNPVFWVQANPVPQNNYTIPLGRLKDFHLNKKINVIGGYPAYFLFHIICAVISGDNNVLPLPP
ncbi:hypothetical protein, partial [Aeromonas salmonicida]|uniref:hypothetical protein n=1 Tax=Aeromonas salmonicida TaxID=645 RepID=UPI001ED94E12